MTTTDPTLDADLAAAVRRTGKLRTALYLVVLGLALGGSASGAHLALHLPKLIAVLAVAALELGGIVVMNNADVRRRLGERSTASRMLSATIAVGAVTFNWMTHSDHLLGGFFAGMSALGYLVWLMHTENQRRDRLRAKGDLPPTSPVYGAWRWLRHPWLTRRARELALRDTSLGLYGSLDEARAETRGERRRAAIAKVLHRKIRAAVDPATADIATAVYDLDEIAGRLAAEADYDGLTAMIVADLRPARMLAELPVKASAAIDPPAAPAITSEPTPVSDTDHDAEDFDDLRLAVFGTPREITDNPAFVSDTESDSDSQDDQPKRSRRRPTTAEKIQQVRKRDPKLPIKDIAAKVGVSDRTVSRHLNPPATKTASAATPELAMSDSGPVNGHDHTTD